jgi:hypothetical protein
VLNPGGAEGRAPAALVGSRQLEIEALVRHATLDGGDATPGVEPGTERRERMDVRPQVSRF